MCIGVSSSALFSTVSADCVSVLETGSSLIEQISLNGGLKCRLYEMGFFSKGLPFQSQIFLVDNKAFLCCIVSESDSGLLTSSIPCHEVLIAT